MSQYPYYHRRQIYAPQSSEGLDSDEALRFEAEAMRVDPSLSLRERMSIGLDAYAKLQEVKGELEAAGDKGREQFQRRLEAWNQLMTDAINEFNQQGSD